MDIGLEDLVAKICEVAEEEEAFWQPGSGARITDTTDPGKGRVLEYLTYLWDGTVPLHGRSKHRFDPAKHGWSAIFVSYCVAKAFEQLFGPDSNHDVFRKAVPLDRSQFDWFYARSAYRKRQSGRSGANTRGYYWAYDAGVSIEQGDIVLSDRRSLKAGQTNLTYGDLGKLGWAMTHGGIVTKTSDTAAVVLGGDVEDGVRRASFALKEDGRIDRTLRETNANRTFAVLRLKPDVEMVASSGARHTGILFNMMQTVVEQPMVPYRVCASGAEVIFPSGESLCVAPEKTSARLVKTGAEHWDNFSAARPILKSSPLLEVEGKWQVQLSDHFTVGNLIRVGHGPQMKYARIDPRLIQFLETLRQRLGKPINITSGYRSYQYNIDLYKRNKLGKPSVSAHTRGIAADIWVAGMTGMQLAKAAIDTFGCEMGLGVFMSPKTNYNTIHVDSRQRWTIWTYPGGFAKEKEELVQYRLTKHGCG